MEARQSLPVAGERRLVWHSIFSAAEKPDLPSPFAAGRGLSRFPIYSATISLDF